MTHSPSTRAIAAVSSLPKVSFASPGSRTARIARPSASTRSSRVRRRCPLHPGCNPAARQSIRAGATQRVATDQESDDPSSFMRRPCRDSTITASTAADAPVSGMDANDA